MQYMWVESYRGLTRPMEKVPISPAIRKSPMEPYGENSPRPRPVQGGKIRALAVTGSERSSELPDVPSMAEAGYPEVNIGLWSGVFVSAGTPPAIAHKLDTELRRALADGGVREKLKAMAVNPGGGPAEEFRQKIDGDIKVFADVVKAANLKFEE